MFTYYSVFVKTSDYAIGCQSADFATVEDACDFVIKLSHKESIKSVVIDSCKMYISESDHKMHSECGYIATNMAQVIELMRKDRK